MADPYNQAAMDRFTSAHAGIGITMAAFGIPWWATLASTVGWELLENRIKDARPDLFPYSSHDSIANSVSDSVAVMLGFWSTRYAMGKGLSAEGRAALSSAVGATLGSFLGSVSFGLLGRATKSATTQEERGLQIQSHGQAGYHVGCGMGGAAGAMIASQRRVAALIGGGLGGSLGGPIGAAFGTYLVLGSAAALRESGALTLRRT